MTWNVIHCMPKEKCKTCVAYSTATDDSTEVKFIAHLVVFNAGVNEDFQSVEALSYPVTMKQKTGAGEIVFSTGKHFK